MLDHIGLTVGDVARAKAFYDTALAPVGVALVMSVSAEQTGGQAYLGYGSNGRPYFWVGGGGMTTGALHVAFTAPTAPRWTPSTRPPWPPEAATTARPA